VGLVGDPRRRELVEDLIDDIHVLLAQYMRALVILSLAAFTVYSAFFLAMGVPYAVLLAALGGVLEFIPMLGPLVSIVLIVGVAWLSGGNVLVVLLIMVAYRMATDYVLSPRLMGSGVELHPLVVLFGVFAGAEIAGIPGTFLSVPVLALARVVWVRVRKAHAAAYVAS
jgi:predicted PurR-regulated permease PerM